MTMMTLLELIRCYFDDDDADFDDRCHDHDYCVDRRKDDHNGDKDDIYDPHDKEDDSYLIHVIIMFYR
jgi:hypothetical protein